MHVRPLKIGEEAAWVRLNGDAATFDAKLRDLVAYRTANPTLHAATYLVALDGERIVGKLRTNTDDATHYGLALLSVDPDFGYAAVGGALVEHAKSVLTDRLLEAGSWIMPADEAWHELLLGAGFRVHVEKAYFRRDLEGYRSPYADPFSYRSLAELGEEEFLLAFARVIPRGDYFDLRVGAGTTFDARQWQIAFLNGAPAGVVIPKIFDDMPEEGTIHNFGVVPELRGKGLGKVLHAKGLADLASAGAVRYVGSTDRLNAPMIATFKANDCRERGIRRQYRRADAVVTARLTLEPLVAAHAPKLFPALQNAALYRFLPQDPPSLAYLTEGYAFWERRKSPDGAEHWLNWALFSRQDEAYVGTAQATVRPDGTAMLAYTIFEEFWGKGFATEACREVIAHVAGTYGTRVFEAFIDTRNEGSLRVAERLGMTRQERIEGADHFKGSASDEYRYQLTLEIVTTVTESGAAFVKKLRAPL